jgi:DNA-binding Xre family transcriptional regulator
MSAGVLTRKRSSSKRFRVAEKAQRLTLTQMRLRRAMSATELAVQAKVSTSTITAIERGAEPRMSTIRKLAAALGCEPQDIAWPGNPFGLLEDNTRPDA